MASPTQPQLSRALVLHGAKDLRLESRPITPPADDEVQVSIRATGICGSDLHYYYQGRNGAFVVRQPLCLGHESAGQVTAVGKNAAKTHRVGQRVALEVGIPCRKCRYCLLQDRYNICRSLRFRSSASVMPHLDGTLMDVTNHPADLCHILPDSISEIQGALIEPLAVCIHAINRSRPPNLQEVTRAKSLGADTGDSETVALVFGAGAIGLLLTSALAATQPFTSVIVADKNPNRLKIAESLPFSNIRTYQFTPTPTPTSTSTSPPPDPTEEDTTAKALANDLTTKFNLPFGFSRVFDCTGSPLCVRSAIYASSVGGAVVQIGMGGPSLPTIPMGAAALREVDLVGVLRYDRRCYPAAVELMSSPSFNAASVSDKIVTHTVELGDDAGHRGFTLAGSGTDESGKPVVKVVITGGGQGKE